MINTFVSFSRFWVWLFSVFEFHITSGFYFHFFFFSNKNFDSTLPLDPIMLSQFNSLSFSLSFAYFVFFLCQGYPFLAASLASWVSLSLSQSRSSLAFLLSIAYLSLSLATSRSSHNTLPFSRLVLGFCFVFLWFVFIFFFLYIFLLSCFVFLLLFCFCFWS